MTKIIHALLVSTGLVGMAGAACAANAGADPKRPDPSAVHFLDGYSNPNATGTTSVLGHLYFHRERDAINVEYRPAERPDPTATKIVVVCADNGARIDIPINHEYLGPLPVCNSLSKLRFAAE